MNYSMWRGFVFSVVAAVAFAFPGVSFGYLYGNWGSASSITISDPAEDASKRKDILKAWWTQDAGSYYFRMDLRGNPTTNETYYEILIDSKPGAGGTISTATGVDYVLRSDYGHHKWVTNLLEYESGKHNFSPYQSIPGSDFLITGKTLEWRIDASYISGDFSYWGATAENFHEVYDITMKSAQTPIPSTAWLFCAGMVALVGLRRRRARESQ